VAGTTLSAKGRCSGPKKDPRGTAGGDKVRSAAKRDERREREVGRSTKFWKAEGERRGSKRPRASFRIEKRKREKKSLLSREGESASRRKAPGEATSFPRLTIKQRASGKSEKEGARGWAVRMVGKVRSRHRPFCRKPRRMRAWTPAGFHLMGLVRDHSRKGGTDDMGRVHPSGRNGRGPMPDEVRKKALGRIEFRPRDRWEGLTELREIATSLPGRVWGKKAGEVEKLRCHSSSCFNSSYFKKEGVPRGGGLSAPLVLGGTIGGGGGRRGVENRERRIRIGSLDILKDCGGKPAPKVVHILCLLNG